MSERTPLDPFGPTANPQFYVPRVGTERVLDRLAALLGPEERGLVLLTGPPGLGKTQLLRILAERLPRGTEALYLPIASLSIGELCAYALSLMNVAGVEDAEERLVEHAREAAARGHRLILLCDDASALGSAAAKLAALLAESAGALSAVLVSDDTRAGLLRSALGPGIPEVCLRDPMTAAETARYVRVRLAEAEIDPLLWQAFDRQALERIHQASKGIPRCVNQEAEALLREVASRRAIALPETPQEEPETARSAQTPDPALPAAPAAEAPIPPLRVQRARARRTRLLRVAEVSLATLAAAIAALLVLRSEVPPPLQTAAGPGSPVTQSAERTPAVSTGPPPAAHRAEETASLPASPPTQLDQPEEPKPTKRPPTPAGPPSKPAAPAAATPSNPSSAAMAPSATTTAPPPVATPSPSPAAPAAPTPPPEPQEQAAAAPAAPAPVSEPAPAPPVSVNVNADPWARVEIDGKAVGVTPLAGVPLSPGEHAFRATLPDGRVIERQVRIDANSRYVHFP